MTATVRRNRPVLPETVVFATLPGPSRKRLQTPYCYRLTYRAVDIHTPGCVLMWEVLGGREIYQIALERLASGGLHWHCTCADAIFRGQARHFCKHIRGLILQGREQARSPSPALTSSATGATGATVEAPPPDNSGTSGDTLPQPPA